MEFNLQEGEKIVKDLKPVKNVLWFLILSNAIPVVLIMCSISFMFGLAIFTKKISFAFSLFAIGLFVLLIFLIGVAIIIALLQFQKLSYWITNKRIVFKRGIIGFSISSIPLERISDIILSRSFVEMIFGFGSLHVQSLAGQYNPTTRRGSEASLLGVPEPEKTQELIFKLVKEKRKTEKLSF